MGRLLRFVLVAAAVLFAQHAAQLHAFAHLEGELGHAQAGGASALPGQQPEGECLALHMLGCGPQTFVAVPPHAVPHSSAAALPAAAARRAPRLEFLSRAPPARP